MATKQMFFHQDCQVCGRRMLVLIHLFGEPIQCGHCNAICEAGGDNDQPWVSTFAVKSHAETAAVAPETQTANSLA